MKQINRALFDLAEFGYIFVKSKSQAKQIAKRCTFVVDIQKTSHGWFRVSVPKGPFGCMEFKRANWVVRKSKQLWGFILKKCGKSLI